MVHDIDFYRVAFLRFIPFFEGTTAAVEPSRSAQAPTPKVNYLEKKIYIDRLVFIIENVMFPKLGVGASPRLKNPERSFRWIKFLTIGKIC